MRSSCTCFHKSELKSQLLFVVTDINFHDRFDKSHKDEIYTEKYTETKHIFSYTFINVQIINETYVLFIIHLLM